MPMTPPSSYNYKCEMIEYQKLHLRLKFLRGKFIDINFCKRLNHRTSSLSFRTSYEKLTAKNTTKQIGPLANFTGKIKQF